MTTTKKATRKKAAPRKKRTPVTIEQPTKEVVTSEPSSIVVARERTENFTAMIERAASNPDTDVTKMERLWEMSKEMMDRASASEYNAAMTEVQAQIPAIKKLCENKQTNSTYADLQTIVNAIRPAYTSHGFSLSFSEGECPTPDTIRVYLDVSHTGGDVRRFQYDNPIDNAGIKGNVNKTPTHGKASAVSYAQRYLTNLVFMLEFANADDDGNAAGQAPRELITDDQALKIEALLSDHELDKEAFMAWVLEKINVEHIADIPADWHKQVISTINATINARKHLDDTQ